jgi:hypothetical protein
MRFEADDLDWAMGELFTLFARADRLGIDPHRLDPAVFHSAWSVLNAQPFPIRKQLYERLTALRNPTRPVDARFGTKGRYENAVAL